MNERVMVVDDDPAVLDTVRLVMEGVNYELRLVDSGSKCLEELRRGFRGVILMDIMMPHMDGWDTISAIVQEGLVEGNVISMLTAVKSPGPRMAHLKQYVLDYVRKPFTQKDLFEAIGSAAECLPG